jgi:ADP-ribose pyrophosphatase YjhB (NUDIX family)
VATPAKHSVAVLIRKGTQILALRRPDDDDELPGIWGLPAGTLRASETVEDLIRRIGRDKLGAELRGIQRIIGGHQHRMRYRLEMELWEAEMANTPSRGQWKWAELSLLEEGRSKGSFCCELALRGT